MRRSLGTVLRRLVHRLLSFEFWQARGVHILPVAFDRPVPDTRTLDDSIWERRSSLPGIDLREDEQLALLRRFEAAYRDEYRRFPLEPTSEPHRYHVDNGGFESVDGEILHCMVRDLKPDRIYEIASGNSTLVSAAAALMNEAEGHPPCRLVAYEPYPSDTLRAGVPGLSALEPVKAQEIPLERFAELGDRDILFIDSSHMLKLDSDVQYLYLEVLPRLRPGVVVHAHDIFLPAEYPRAWVMENHWFWNEQYLLQAFLAFNDAFEVLWAGSFMHLRHPAELADAFPSYDPRTRWPGSFWLRKVKP